MVNAYKKYGMLCVVMLYYNVTFPNEIFFRSYRESNLRTVPVPECIGRSLGSSFNSSGKPFTARLVMRNCNVLYISALDLKHPIRVCEEITDCQTACIRIRRI